MSATLRQGMDAKNTRGERNPLSPSVVVLLNDRG
jgi:hypothetical protein